MGLNSLPRMNAGNDPGELMVHLTLELIQLALAGDRNAQEILVKELTPTLQWEVGKMLRKWRTGPAASRNLAQEVGDLVQETWSMLFERDAKVLREWDPSVLPLEAWAGYLARTKTAQVLRSPRAQWREEPISPVDLPEETYAESHEREFWAREKLKAIYLCLAAKFKPADHLLFDLLFIQEKAVATISELLDRSREAIYQWRSRLSRRAKECDEKVSMNEGSTEGP